MWIHPLLYTVLAIAKERHKKKNHSQQKESSKNHDGDKTKRLEDIHLFRLHQHFGPHAETLRQLEDMITLDYGTI